MEDKVVLKDWECYPNFLCVGIEGLESKTKTLFEVSDEKDDREKLYKFYSTFSGYFITFNGIFYDNVLAAYFIMNYKRLSKLSKENFLLEMKEFSNKIIAGDEYFDQVKMYKWYKRKWTDIDLFMYWSKLLRQSKQISLKALGVQLGYPVIQELPFYHASLLTNEQLPVVREYNTKHDLGILRMLAERMMEDIGQRKAAIKSFGFRKDCYSWDGVKLGLNILVKEYCDEYGLDSEDVKTRRTLFPSEGIKLKDIIFDTIAFTKTEEKVREITDSEGTVKECNSFHTLLQDLKRTTVFSTNDLSYTVTIKDLRYDVKSGGLHSFHLNEKVFPDLTKVIYRDADVIKLAS